ncbi:MAG: type II secretion system F family protein [Caulobacteraceae bacterium]
MLMVLLVAVLAFVAVGGVGYALVGGESSQARALKRVQTAGPAAKSERNRSPQDVAINRRKQIVQNLRTVERQQRKQTLTLDGRLSQAGLSPNVRGFWIVSAVLAVLAGGIGLLASHNPLIALGGGVMAGLGLPRWALGVLGKRRLKAFTSEFPNATDIIVRGIKSGLPVHDCLRVIARESPQPLAGEFQRLVENLAMGQSTEMALEKLYVRMPTSEVRFFSIVLSIQQKTGGNLAEALNNLSTVLRARKLMHEKIKAMSGEAVASGAIIASLPPAIMILVSLTTPGYMIPMFNDPRGHIMLMIGASWMACGVFVMRKMINFKF